MNKPTTADVERFFDKFQITNTCWWWKTTKGQRIYGEFGVNGKRIKAHRFSYVLFVGPIELGKHILHKRECGNPSCVNPLHLYMGTHQDNMDDKRLWGNTNIKVDYNTMPNKTFSTSEILALSGAVFYRLYYLVNSGQITPLSGSSGNEFRFSAEEAVKAVGLLRPGGKSSLEELEEMTNG